MSNSFKLNPLQFSRGRTFFIAPPSYGLVVYHGWLNMMML